MAIDNFVPEVWASSILEFLNKSLVYGNVVTREYQSNIVNIGDTIRINTFANPVISDYTKNGTVGAPETLVGSTQSLLIDQAKSFNFEIDDIDATQQVPKIMNDAMAQAAYGFSDTMDQFIASLHTGVAAANAIGTDILPEEPTSVNIYSYFTQAKRLLRQANVPMNDLWAVIPPWMEELVLNSGEFTAASSLGDEVKVTGSIGRIAGFMVYVSNNVANTTDTLYKVMFGYPRAIALAEQINKVEAFSPHDSFSDAIKGLHVYGGKLIQDTGIVVLTANPPA